jgi:type II secretory pathway pseudopilin PulG
LLEIIISIAILGAVLGAVGPLITAGTNAAVRSELNSEAIIRAETAMSEIVAGVQSRKSAGNESFPDNGDWTWTLEVAPGPYAELEILTVKVEHKRKNGDVDSTAHLSRMVRTDDAMIPVVTEDASATTN